jgi:chemotaxis protein histidine kinase CheA
MTKSDRAGGYERSFDAEFEALREKFYTNMVRDAVLMVEALDRIMTDSSYQPDDDAIYDIVFKAHKMAGRGGTFGYAEVSVHAQKLERALNDARDALRAGTSPDFASIQAHVQTVADAVRDIENAA